MIQRLSAISKGRFHPDKRCLPENKTLSQAAYLQRLYSQCQRIGAAVLEWAELAVSKRSLQACRAIVGVVNLSKKYSHELINQACRQSLEKNLFNYHIVKETAETLLTQKRIQPEIPFVQESDIIRSPHEYQQLLLPARRSGGKESTWMS